MLLGLLFVVFCCFGGGGGVRNVVSSFLLSFDIHVQVVLSIMPVMAL